MAIILRSAIKFHAREDYHVDQDSHFIVCLTFTRPVLCALAPYAMKDSIWFVGPTTVRLLQKHAPTFIWSREIRLCEMSCDKDIAPLLVNYFVAPRALNMHVGCIPETATSSTMTMNANTASSSGASFGEFLCSKVPSLEYITFSSPRDHTKPFVMECFIALLAHPDRRTRCGAIRTVFRLLSTERDLYLEPEFIPVKRKIMNHALTLVERDGSTYIDEAWVPGLKLIALLAEECSFRYRLDPNTIQRCADEVARAFNERTQYELQAAAAQLFRALLNHESSDENWQSGDTVTPAVVVLLKRTNIVFAARDRVVRGCATALDSAETSNALASLLGVLEWITNKGAGSQKVRAVGHTLDESDSFVIDEAKEVWNPEHGLDEALKQWKAANGTRAMRGESERKCLSLLRRQVDLLLRIRERFELQSRV